MSAKHTPGPWRFDGDWWRRPTIYGGKVEVATINKAWFPERDGRGGEQEANALLIAAAPELLEALELVVTRCGPHSTDGAIARAAIAKARGAA